MNQDPKSKLTAESIEPWDLPRVSIDKKSQLPDSPGIYFVLRCRSIVYIGISEVSLKRRWSAHHRFKTIEAMGDASIAYCEYQGEGIKDIEDRLIDIFMPKLNDEFVDPLSLKALRLELNEANGEADTLRLQAALSEYKCWVLQSVMPSVKAFEQAVQYFESPRSYDGMMSMAEDHKRVVSEQIIPLLAEMHNSHTNALDRLVLAARKPPKVCK